MANDRTQERYFPSTYERRSYPEAQLEVGIQLGEPSYVIAYFGGAYRKSTFHYRFKTAAHAEEYLREKVEDYSELVRQRRIRKEARFAAPRGMEEGDVLKCVWGYDQTNVDFYQVVRVKGKNKVVIRQIRQQSEETGYMSGKCWPLVGQFVDDAPEMMKVARDGAVRIASYASAHVFKPDATDEEVFETGSRFRSSGYTSYA